MILILISLGALLCTMCGGLFAIRFKDKLHLILGFSAGAVIGVAFFDLLPEAIALGGRLNGIQHITGIVALGFLTYLLLDRLTTFHTHTHMVHQDVSRRGILGAGSLSVHSFLDGVAIGLAFQASAAVGMIVAIAVLVHDFSDGINTVNLVLKNNGTRRQALRWLFVDAAAPVLGVFSTLFFTLLPRDLGIVLAVFCGFFLYIGASDLLPESYHRHSTFWTTLSTLLGAAVLYAAVHLAAI